MANLAGLKECAEALALKEGISKVEAEKRVKSVVEVIADKCVAGGVSFKGMFSLKKVVRKGRSGKINGIEYNNSDKNSLKVTVGTELEEKLNTPN